MDVNAQIQQMSGILDWLTLELTLKEGANTMKAFIDGFGLRDAKLLHGKRDSSGKDFRS